MDENKKDFHFPPISPASPGPLYQQIVDGIKSEITRGRLHPGSPLPSFRFLAERLLVSLITVKRAYEELEREGIIFRKQGLGTFISENGAARNSAIKKQNATILMNKAVKEALEANMPPGEILSLAKRIISQSKGETKK